MWSALAAYKPKGGCTQTGCRETVRLPPPDRVGRKPKAEAQHRTQVSPGRVEPTGRRFGAGEARPQGSRLPGAVRAIALFAFSTRHRQQSRPFERLRPDKPTKKF